MELKKSFKGLLLASLLISFTPSLLFAQLQFGIDAAGGMGGIRNSASVKYVYDGQDPEGYKTIKQKFGVAIYGGGVISYKFNYAFCVDLGLYYMKYGSNITLYSKDLPDTIGSYIERNSEVTLSNSSLFFPLAAKLLFAKPSKPGVRNSNWVVPFIAGGPTLEYRLTKLLSATEEETQWDKLTQKSQYGRHEFKKEELDGLPDLAFGVRATVGMRIVVGRGNSTLNIAAHYGTTIGNNTLWLSEFKSGTWKPYNVEIFEDEYQHEQGRLWKADFKDWRNSNLTLSVGMLF